MKNIIVAIDFSSVSKNAAEYACEFSKVVNANITLMHAYHIPPSINETPVLVSYEQMQELNEKLLQKEAIRLKKQTGISTNCIVKIGIAADEILEEAKSYDLIIMGIRDVDKFSEMLIGSTATSVMKKSTTPVLIIPENCSFKKPANIVFTCDFNHNINSKSINALKRIQTIFNSTVNIISVRNKELPNTTEAIGGVLLERELENTKHVYYFINNENIVDGINEFIERYNGDMVATIPHNHNFIEKLFHKSISKTIAFHSQLPTFCIPEYQS